MTTATNSKAYRSKVAVGYRVKSKRGTSFRQWATRVLRQYP